MPASDDALLAEFGAAGRSGAKPDAIAINRRVVTLLAAIGAARIPGIRNLHPAYSTLLVVFDPLRWTHAALIESLSRLAAELPASSPARPLIPVPMCCDAEFAPDLEWLAGQAGLPAAGTAGLFSSVVYRVAFLGFAPGFPYLLGLPERLAAPRLESPRVRVPAGSVAVGGNQAGIYPNESPGGWRIIGRTPLRLFDTQREPMSLFEPGDEVHFYPVSRAQFEELAAG